MSVDQIYQSTKRTDVSCINPGFPQIKIGVHHVHILSNPDLFFLHNLLVYTCAQVALSVGWIVVARCGFPADYMCWIRGF
jgi:hypothetical protein